MLAVDLLTAVGVPVLPSVRLSDLVLDDFDPLPLPAVASFLLRLVIGLLSDPLAEANNLRLSIGATTSSPSSSLLPLLLILPSFVTFRLLGDSESS
jgi:hypothetical protein